MANERKTEQITRTLLRKLGYYNDRDIIIEEQKSDSPKIQKLLKNASKKGDGAGYPEFMITHKIYTNFIIVIECKADIKKHQSKTLDKFVEYAVDGSLLYASYLSKEYHVLAIGISGEKEKELKISHNLVLKNSNPKLFSGNEFLSFENYYKSYTHSNEKFNNDLSKLLEFSKELNSSLHTNKIKESKRALLISGILIALKNNVFSKNYKEYESANELTEELVNTILKELKKSNIPKEKIINLKLAYSFILTHFVLSTDKSFLENLISDINKHLNSFMQTYKYFDILGQFYIEFLRYANSDKGLGIVLTPPHITELFADLAEVNKESIVFDNCTGTSGFLISAMQKMIEDSNGNEEKIKEIKLRQIVGIEQDDEIYALAISNMIIHGDGKSNIFQGNCFNYKNNDLYYIDENENKVTIKPNVGFLNPPYQSDKKNDIDEYEFILNNLEMLEKGGTCIAIVPMQLGLATKGDKYEYKKKVLENHTLEAVLSMPDELFFNSKVGVVTEIMILSAHKPHSKNKKTWFGYFKDDGFVKDKAKGRADLNDTWQQKKNKWLESFVNREVVDGFSIMQTVTADDEWCSEAYMKTDYSKLEQENFEDVIKNYLSFKVSNFGEI